MIFLKFGKKFGGLRGIDAKWLKMDQIIDIHRYPAIPGGFCVILYISPHTPRLGFCRFLCLKSDSIFFRHRSNWVFSGAMMRAFKPLFGVFSSTPYHGGLPGWIWDNSRQIPPTLGSSRPRDLGFLRVDL